MEDAMLNEVTVTKFKDGLRGPLVQPKDAAYDDARKLYNGMIDKRPLAIAGCVDAADVIAAVNFGSQGARQPGWGSARSRG
jgi:hypothetical protein